jgi:hypothetical protein
MGHNGPGLNLPSTELTREFAAALDTDTSQFLRNDDVDYQSLPCITTRWAFIASPFHE